MTSSSSSSNNDHAGQHSDGQLHFWFRRIFSTTVFFSMRWSTTWRRSNIYFIHIHIYMRLDLHTSEIVNLSPTRSMPTMARALLFPMIPVHGLLLDLVSKVSLFLFLLLGSVSPLKPSLVSAMSTPAPPAAGIDFASLPWNMNLSDKSSYIHVTTTSEFTQEHLDKLEDCVYSYADRPLPVHPATTSLNYGKSANHRQAPSKNNDPSDLVVLP